MQRGFGTTVWRPVAVLYHDQVVEEEDFSLVRRLLLGLVDVGHLEEPTAAHQPSVGDGEDLGGRKQPFTPFDLGILMVSGLTSDRDERANDLATQSETGNLTDGVPVIFPTTFLFAPSAPRGLFAPQRVHTERLSPDVSSLVPPRGTQTASQLAQAGRIFHSSNVRDVKMLLAPVWLGRWEGGV